SVFVQVESRRRPGPRWATLLIVVVCVACFVALSLLPLKQEVAWVMRWGTVPSRLFALTGTWWQDVLNPNWLCLLSSLFIHVAWAHLLTNMLFLVIFGLAAERALGSRRFLFLFLLGGVFAN